ncbi:hypothetical protein PGTUg99_007825 [Puccinia graminis f. sp. tritici]|uniref:Uncharacterized protein n=1 Tax=Puccinia graminis f. sp. tritici TaxID=56615 RepID=A0A5B0LJP3_PUCGR|nr:hypothetical protein PGTUg99_007825 [Puccinia graminis f. sp. tritici]
MTNWLYKLQSSMSSGCTSLPPPESKETSNSAVVYLDRTNKALRTLLKWRIFCAAHPECRERSERRLIARSTMQYIIDGSLRLSVMPIPIHHWASCRQSIGTHQPVIGHVPIRSDLYLFTAPASTHDGIFYQLHEPATKITTVRMALQAHDRPQICLSCKLQSSSCSGQEFEASINVESFISR